MPIEERSLLRKMSTLRLRLSQSAFKILGSQIGLLAMSLAYTQQNPHLASQIAVGITFSMAGTVALFNAQSSLDLKSFRRMFKSRSDGMRAMLSAHDTLFRLTGYYQGEPLTKSLRTILNVVQLDSTGFPSLPSNTRITATGIKPNEKMVGSVADMAGRIVQEAMFHICTACVDRDDSLPLAAQQYVLAKAPEWLQQHPDLFDAPLVELTYPGLLSALTTLKAISLSDQEQVVALRQWVDSGCGNLTPSESSLPELGATTSMFVTI